MWGMGVAVVSAIGNAPGWAFMAAIASLPLFLAGALWNLGSLRSVTIGPQGLQIRSGPGGMWPGLFLARAEIGFISIARYQEMADENTTPRILWAVDLDAHGGGRHRLEDGIATAEQAKDLADVLRAAIDSAGA